MDAWEKQRGRSRASLSSFSLFIYSLLLSNKSRKYTKGSFFTAQWGIEVSEEGGTTWIKIWKLETMKREQVVIGSWLICYCLLLFDLNGAKTDWIVECGGGLILIAWKTEGSSF